MSGNKEAAEARAAGKVRFKPSRPCKKHPYAEFYTSNAQCTECLAENGRKNYDAHKRAEYWESVKNGQNDRRRYKYYLERGTRAAKGLMEAGHPKAKAVELVLARFDIHRQDLLAQLETKTGEN